MGKAQRIKQTKVLPPSWPGCEMTWLQNLPGTRRPLHLMDVLNSYDAHDLRVLSTLWELSARLDQRPPFTAQQGGPWSQWLVIGGRGAGKTRTGAEWVRGVALGLPGFARKPVSRIALVGETMADVRDVMVEGVSGLLTLPGIARPSWEPTRRRLVWPNGAVAQCFSAEDPESLRGPQFECAWLDELAKWRHDQECFDMLQFGLRLGDHPRQIITTTPRPTPLIKKLLGDPKTAISRASTRANKNHLAPDFIARLMERYGGTRLGRQELDGELIEDRQGALWTRDMLDQLRRDKAPDLQRIVVAIDPPASATRRADQCGIIAAGIDREGAIFVLADASLSAARPHMWSATAVALYHKLEADVLIAEVNQGGDMVASVIGEADRSVPVRKVRATRGKYLRAAPVAQLYEQGRVHHVGGFAELEDEMCAFAADGLPNGKSPDRLDALVWAITDLALRPQAAEPRMRRL